MRSVAFTVVLLAAGGGRADDWPQWLGPQRDGVWRETGLLDAFPKGGPKPKWKVKVGLGYAGPAVAGGKVFVTEYMPAGGAAIPANPFARDKVPGAERVRCLDAATGKEVWAADYPCEYAVSYAAGPRCTPTVDGDKVYTLGAMGDLRCYAVADGKLVWAKNFVTDFAAKVPVWGFACHPVVDGDHLICVGGGPDKLVLALNKTTGDVVWGSQSCDGDFGYSPPVVATLGGVRQLVVWHTRAVVGLDPTSGKRLWKFDWDIKSALTAPTARPVGTDMLFLTSFYNGSTLLKVSAAGVTPVWQSKAKGERPAQTTDLSSIMCTPAVAGEYVYGVCSYGELRCLEVMTGKRVWESMTASRGALTPAKVAAQPGPTDGERWGLAFLIPHADRYFLFNEQGDLIIAKLTPKGYDEVSRTHLVDPTNTLVRGRKVVWMHPAFAGKCVFARNDNELVCVSLAKE